MTYTVKAGDNLFRIALNHGLTLTALAQYNHITPPYTIYIGQVIAIPGTGGPVVTPPPVTPTPPTGYFYHVTQPGEYLLSIARLYGSQDWYTLAVLNNLSYPYVILQGQRILIPSNWGSGTSG